MTKYPFFAIHPEPDLSEKVYIHITDVEDVDHFCELWQDWELQDEFGYDLPMHDDDNCAPLEDVTLEEIEFKNSDACVVSMTYDEYEDLIRAYIKADGR